MARQVVERTVDLWGRPLHMRSGNIVTDSPQGMIVACKKDGELMRLADYDVDLGAFEFLNGEEFFEAVRSTRLNVSPWWQLFMGISWVGVVLWKAVFGFFNIVFGALRPFAIIGVISLPIAVVFWALTLASIGAIGYFLMWFVPLALVFVIGHMIFNGGVELKVKEAQAAIEEMVNEIAAIIHGGGDPAAIEGRIPASGTRHGESDCDPEGTSNVHLADPLDDDDIPSNEVLAAIAEDSPMSATHVTDEERALFERLSGTASSTRK